MRHPEIPQKPLRRQITAATTPSGEGKIAPPNGSLSSNGNSKSSSRHPDRSGKDSHKTKIENGYNLYQLCNRPRSSSTKIPKSTDPELFPEMDTVGRTANLHLELTRFEDAFHTFVYEHQFAERHL